MSSAKPPPPRAIAGPTCCAVPPSRNARRSAGSHRRSARVRRRSQQGSLGDRLPPGAPAQMGEQGLADRRLVERSRPLQRGKAHDDARRAEAALGPARGAQGVGPSPGDLGRQSFERRDGAARHPSHWCHAGDASLAVDQDRAAPALPLRAAAILGRADSEAITEHFQQRAAIGRYDHVGSVQREAQFGHDDEARGDRGPGAGAPVRCLSGAQPSTGPETPSGLPTRRWRPADPAAATWSGRACGDDRRRRRGSPGSHRASPRRARPTS